MIYCKLLVRMEEVILLRLILSGPSVNFSSCLRAGNISVLLNGAQPALRCTVAHLHSPQNVCAGVEVHRNDDDNDNNNSNNSSNNDYRIEGTIRDFFFFFFFFL